MIHNYRMNGFNIVLDSNSGAVHVVDDLTYEIVLLSEKMPSDDICSVLGKNYPLKEIKERLEELDELKKQGLFMSEDNYTEALAQVNNRNPVVKAMCLHIAHDCNLKCKYCFAEEGEYHGKRALMSEEVGKKAIDFLIKNSGKRKNLEVDFFGGEPLMNFEVVKEIVKYGREKEKQFDKNFRFTITTNGILLDDKKQEFINENMHNVVLSIDGRQEVNDLMRPKAGGQGSYTNIVPKFQKIAESRNQTDYYVRGTFTRENLDFSEDVMHLADLGFKQISIEPVVADLNESYAIQKEDLEKIFEEYENLAMKIIKRREENKDFNFFHFMIDLTGGPCVSKRLTGCGAGTEYLAVTPEGHLYPCHQFVGQEDFKMGDVYEGIKTPKLREKFEKVNVYSKEECRNCWAKFYCSGGCASNAYNFSGDINIPYEIGCEMQRKRVECAIMLKVYESMDTEEV